MNELSWMEVMQRQNQLTLFWSIAVTVVSSNSMVTTERANAMLLKELKDLYFEA